MNQICLGAQIDDKLGQGIWALESWLKWKVFIYFGERLVGYWGELLKL